MPTVRPSSIEPIGDRAFLARFGSEDEAASWAEGLTRLGWDGVVDVVPAYRTVGVHADPDRVDLDSLAERLARLPAEIGDGPARTGRLIRVPVLYDGEDLPAVAGILGLTERRVVEEHTGVDYRVFAIGFQPGFPYAGYLPDPLCGLARRASPRLTVPAGSVAVVGRQTAIYPAPIPGGWHLIGRTPLTVVDVGRGVFPIRAGDRLRFVAIGPDEFEARRGVMPCATTPP